MYCFGNLSCDPQCRTFPLLAKGSMHLILVPISSDTLRRFGVTGHEAVMGTISPKAKDLAHSCHNSSSSGRPVFRWFSASWKSSESTTSPAT